MQYYWVILHYTWATAQMYKLLRWPLDTAQFSMQNMHRSQTESMLLRTDPEIILPQITLPQLSVVTGYFIIPGRKCQDGGSFCIRTLVAPF